MKGGRHLAFNPADNVPMTNLLVSMLDKAGVRVDTLGDSTGRIDLDTLSGDLMSTQTRGSQSQVCA